MDEYISASKYYKQDTRVQNGTRPQYQTYYKEYICVLLYQPYFENRVVGSERIQNRRNISFDGCLEILTNNLLSILCI